MQDIHAPSGVPARTVEGHHTRLPEEPVYLSGKPSRMSVIVDSVLGALNRWKEGRKSKQGRWKRTVGILLLLATVVLWTASNFLASTIFADNTYSKPYFVTYINTAFFVIPLAPILLMHLYDQKGGLKDWRGLLDKKLGSYALVQDHEDEESASFIKSRRRQDTLREGSPSSPLEMEDELGESQELGRSMTSNGNESLTIAETARLSVEFCIPWFLANYFTAACLEYTTVASSTILASTSSIWTLILGAFVGVERFTVKKLMGVLASLAGVILISSVDISGENDENRGSFPHKTSKEIMIGDALAFLSAVIYSGYAILMKKRLGGEGKVNMPLFFAFIGLFNVLALWPGLVILHLTGVEKFELPPTGKVLTIVLVNSMSSLVSDFCWAWAMLLTSPLVVTVGLSLTIPLSLIGQMVLNAQSSSFMYWVGAGVVFLSFIFVNHEDTSEEEHASDGTIDS